MRSPARLILRLSFLGALLAAVALGAWYLIHRHRVNALEGRIDAAFTERDDDATIAELTLLEELDLREACRVALRLIEAISLPESANLTIVQRTNWIHDTKLHRFELSAKAGGILKRAALERRARHAVLQKLAEKPPERLRLWIYLALAPVLDADRVTTEAFHQSLWDDSRHIRLSCANEIVDRGRAASRPFVEKRFRDFPTTAKDRLFHKLYRYLEGQGATIEPTPEGRYQVK